MEGSIAKSKGQDVLAEVSTYQLQSQRKGYVLVEAGWEKITDLI